MAAAGFMYKTRVVIFGRVDMRTMASNPGQEKKDRLGEMK